MAARKSKKRAGKKSHSASSGLLTHGGVAALIGIIGLVAAFAVIWWQVILEPQAARERAEQTRLLDEYAQFVNGRVTELRAVVGALATSSAASEALLTLDLDKRKATTEMMAAVHPHVSRVEIFEKGKAEIDLNAEVPISFAALDLVRRAESREFVGPEVGPNQGQRLYAAQPLTAEGTVGGVMLVVFEPTFMLDPLQHFTKLQGELQVLQTVQGAPTTPVLSINESKGELPQVEKQLFQIHTRGTRAVGAG